MATQLNSHYANQPMPFLGVRFALFGFGSIQQHQIKSKLVNGGGVDAGQYTQDCTHVIVDNLVYDDPVCVAARKDSKILVTGLWVDHSFDIGMPVDHTSIMYRPLKDLNGIPGAKCFVMCLTGYQRQDRDDVMTMVGLMGAQFSKPLVANKVTHLLCYKFEGEKYELANKMKKIRLVNHKWLEDCLNSWQILPEANYSKSGYELEMEIQAKDSEEEEEKEEDNSTMQFRGRKMNSSPYSVQVGTARTHELHASVGAVSKILLDKDVSIGPSNVVSHEDIPLVTGKDTSSGQASGINKVDEKHHEALGCQKTHNTMLAGQPDHCYGTPISTNVGNDLTFTPVSGKKSPNSGAGKLSGMSYSRKTPRRSTLQTEISNNSSGFPKLQLGEFKSSVGIAISPSKAKQVMDRNEYDCFNTPHKGSGLLHEEECTNLSPQKRKMDASCASSKSQKMSHDLIPCISASLFVGNEVQRLESTPLTHGPSEINKGPSDYNDGIPLDDLSLLSSAKHSPADMFRTKSSSYSRKSLTSILPVSETMTSKIGQDSKAEKAPQNSFGSLEGSAFACKPARVDIALGNSVREVGGTGELQSWKQDFDASSPSYGTMEFAKFHSPIGLGRGNEDSHSKPAEKVVAKKNLGSRGKLGISRTANTANRKGSIYLDRTASQIDTAVCSVGGKGTVSHEEPSNANELEVPACPNSMEILTEMRTTEAPKTGNDFENKNESMDDETEAPDEKDDELEKAVNNRSEVAEVPQKPDVVMEETSEDVQHTAKASTDNATVLKGDHGKAVDGKDIELGESTCRTNDGRGKVSKRKKRPFGKTKINTVRAVTKNSSDNELEGPTCHNSMETLMEMRTTEAPKTGNDFENKNEFMDDETEAPDKKDDELEKAVNNRSEVAEVPQKPDIVTEETSEDVQHTAKASTDNATVLEGDHGNAVDGRDIELGESTCTTNDERAKVSKGKQRPPGKTKNTVHTVAKNLEYERNVRGHDTGTKKICEKTTMEEERGSNKFENTMEVEKENKPIIIGKKSMGWNKQCADKVAVKSVTKNKVAVKSNQTALKTTQKAGKVDADSLQVRGMQKKVKAVPMWFLLTGHQLQRKEFQKIIRHLKGRICRDSHQWSYQATHFIVPDPIRRTEKFFAAAASGRWILNSDYLSASSQAGKFLAEESYEWHKSGLNEDGAINLEAPRKWRLLREKTGHGAFYGMRIIIYGECIAPSLDTLKRAVKAGDGTILATSPPYTRFLNSGVDFAVVSPGMPRVDIWVQEFLKHEIPCVLADYLVEYVCKPGYSLERHVQYNTHAWAEKSFANLLCRSEEIVEDLTTPDNRENDLTCQVCGFSDRGEVMLICGDESGSVGCGIGTHIDCCNPPLKEVPEEDWFCLKCSRSKNSSSPSKNTKKRTYKGK